MSFVLDKIESSINAYRISSHPDLDFVIVVNPQSGPGSSTLPDEAYQAAIRQLNTYPNAQKVGYVRTNYAERNVSEVLDDIARYSDWQSRAADLAMAGIFFDEAPHQFSDATRDYLNRINSGVKDAAGLQGERTVSDPARMNLLEINLRNAGGCDQRSRVNRGLWS